MDVAVEISKNLRNQFGTIISPRDRAVLKNDTPSLCPGKAESSSGSDLIKKSELIHFFVNKTSK